MPEEKNESTENKANDSEGSSNDNNGPANPNMLGGEAGDPSANNSSKDEETVPKTQYTELEKKIGEQGNELGESRGKVKEYEQYFDDISPLMEKLSVDKELIGYITRGEINSKMIEGVLQGKIPEKEATEVTKAHDEVKKEMGKEEYAKASTEDVEKRITEKLKDVDDKFSKMEQSFDTKLADSEQLREYEKKVETFASNTPDLKEYLPRINELMEEHKEISDIKIFYQIAKGEKLEKNIKEEEEKNKSEEEKLMAANLGGGNSYGTVEINDPNVANQLIGNSSNPNLM